MVAGDDLRRDVCCLFMDIIPGIPKLKNKRLFMKITTRTVMCIVQNKKNYTISIIIF